MPRPPTWWSKQSTALSGKFGISGCVGRMAQEFGDHPDGAATRMRWVRRLASRAGAWAPDSQAGELSGLEPEMR
jgi:hypothetical protein